MATYPLLAPSAELREELKRRGGATATRCFQCATCSGVCELAPDDGPFPRRQMLLAQWGQIDRLAADSAVWLCHQCNDCTVRCPRDARPGDVMQALRSLVIERLAAPRAMGKLVSRARVTWPVLLGAPLVLWLMLLGAAGHLAVPGVITAYEQVVPHWMIYSVFFPLSALVLLSAWTSGRRFWALLATTGPPRRGSFFAALVPVAAEIVTHRRFASCDAARPRRWGHLMLFWGFVGAAVTSGLLVVALYGFGMEMPLPLGHPFKVLGNISAVLLVAGGTIVAVQRFTNQKVAGNTTAFDTFFVSVVVLVIATGVAAEVARLAQAAGAAAAAIYIVHLTAVFTLFATFPYSKFAHMLYRTLAMIHERMTR